MVWAFWLFEAFLRWLTSSIVEQFLNLIVLYILGILSDFYFMLFSDFDLTCIVVDLSAILAAIVTALKSDQSPTYSQITWMSFTDLRNTWSDFPRQYTEEYEQCIETILSANKGIYIMVSIFMYFEGWRGGVVCAEALCVLVCLILVTVFEEIGSLFF